MTNFVHATYIVSGLLFIFALAGLSRFQTSKRGNAFGILGMALALIATVASVVSPEEGEALDTLGIILLVGAVSIGAVVGIRKALKVEMTGMPELIALLHSFVGLAAVLVGFNSYLEGSADTFHLAEVYIGIFIGAVTFTGSIVAWGKLSEKLPSRPLTLPGRHWMNLAAIILIVGMAFWFVPTRSIIPLILMTILALLLGIHLVAAIGGADMPVVISMLNSYSGWAGTTLISTCG